VFGVGWHTAMAAVVEHGTPLVEDPARLDGVRSIGLDETTFLRANARHHTEYITGFVDIDRARLLDVAQVAAAQLSTAGSPSGRADGSHRSTPGRSIRSVATPTTSRTRRS
jgi:hypothetical protein